MEENILYAGESFTLEMQFIDESDPDNPVVITPEDIIDALVVLDIDCKPMNTYRYSQGDFTYNALLHVFVLNVQAEDTKKYCNGVLVYEVKLIRNSEGFENGFKSIGRAVLVRVENNNIKKA